MAYYSRRRYRPGYRRRYKRPGYRARPVRRMSRYPSKARFGSHGLPKAIFTKLNYSEQISMSSVTVTPGSYFFQLNSIYDPNTSGVGHQPYMRDTYSSLYSDYTVTGALVRLTVSTGGSPATVTMRPNPGTGTITNIPLEAERGAARLTVTTAKPVSKKMYVSMAQFFGQTRNIILTDDIYSAAMGTSPTEGCYLGLAVLAADEATSITVYIDIKITYYVKFSNFIDQGES